MLRHRSQRRRLGGRALPGAGSIREGRATLRAGAGDPGKGPGPEAPARGHKPQWPGDALQQPKQTKAEPLYHRALAIWEKALGPEHPDVASCLGNYAGMLRNMGRSEEAEPLEARARAIRAKSV